MTPYQLLTKLFPIRRSLTGPGVRETLSVINDELDDLLTIQEVPSGTKAYDWVVPPEWRFDYGRMYKTDSVDTSVFNTRNLNRYSSSLQVVGYSAPIDTTIQEKHCSRLTDKHVHVGPRETPDAIPYVTAYYSDPPTWGICLSYNQYKALDLDVDYRVEIVSEFLPNGHLSYAEAVIPGELDSEIVLSSYVCHSAGMANNECSGPAVLTALVKWWREKPRRYTLRVLLAPETIGPLVWMSQRHTLWTGLDWLQSHVKAGFTLTCMGGNGNFYIQQGREPNYASRIAGSALLSWDTHRVRRLGWPMRMSDERQWCAPGIDLPWATIMKTHPSDPDSDYKHRYHTSADDLTYVTEPQIDKSVDVMKSILLAVESDRNWQTTVLGEPQLSKRGLYDPISKVGSSAPSRELLDVLSYCDGRSMLDIAEKLNIPLHDVSRALDKADELGLIKECD